MRYLLLDNLKGVAFVLMIIHHFFYFNDLSNNNTTSYANNILIDSCGTIARTLFIFLIGINMNFIKNKNKRFKRSLEIAVHALIISLVTYYFYPDKFIRFGILHFVSLATILATIFIDKQELTLLFILIFISGQVPISKNPIINLVTGAKIEYNAIDYFPLFPWFGLVLAGLYIGKITDFNKLNNLNNIKLLNTENILTYFGRNSLNLYTSHVIFLIIIYTIKNKFIK